MRRMYYSCWSSPMIVLMVCLMLVVFVMLKPSEQLQLGADPVQR